MPDSAFREPTIALSRVYTRSGDSGETNLANGRRVRKDDPRVEAYGTVDELNAFVGRAAIGAAALAPLDSILLRVQHELFNLGSQIATDPGALGSRQPRILPEHIERLETELDAMNEQLPELESFVLPGGAELNADLHVCRAVCRRAERRVVSLAAAGTGERGALAVPIQYLNRLSDAFFVWSRWVCHRTGAPETLWRPNETL